MEKCIQIIIKGKVQGVFFRDFTQKQAESLGLKGTVRNRRDGSVEVFACGDEVALQKLEKWCWEGSPYSRVTGVLVEEDGSMPGFHDFRVIY